MNVELVTRICEEHFKTGSRTCGMKISEIKMTTDDEIGQGWSQTAAAHRVASFVLTYAESRRIKCHLT